MKQLVSSIGTLTGGQILTEYARPALDHIETGLGNVVVITNAEKTYWKHVNEDVIAQGAITVPYPAETPYSFRIIGATPVEKYAEQTTESDPGPIGEFLDKEFAAHSDQDVTNAREKLADAINAAAEDGRGEISDETALTAAELLGVAEQYKGVHEVLTYITSDNDAITKVTDWLGNYVVMKSRSFEDPVVHLKIRGYKECEDSDQAKDVANLFLSCLKQKPSDA